MTLRNMRQEIGRLAGELIALQADDGSWRFCLDSGISGDAFLIALLRAQKWEEPQLMRALAARIAARQEADGSWKRYPDEPVGNLEATVEGYYALLLSGLHHEREERLARARAFIIGKGGLGQVRSMLTQVLLAATGQAEWPGSLRLPIEFLLAPVWFPANLFDLSGHARVHLVPIMMMASRQYAAGSSDLPDLSSLFLGGSRKFEHDGGWLARLMKLLSHLPLPASPLQGASMRKAETFLLERIEPDGTLLTFPTATILMMFALEAQGYDRESEVMKRALAGVKSVVWHDEPAGEAHLQLATSTLWDTAQLAGALQEARLPEARPALERAAGYILERQQSSYGDWKLRNPGVKPGGFGFSDVNTLYPDTDDTAAALRAVRASANRDLAQRARWQDGLRWLITMQNDDGGWPAFERGVDHPLIASAIPFEGSKSIVLDPSEPDLTARVVVFLCRTPGLTGNREAVQRAVDWLLGMQKPDGSWKGRWGICFVHGTAAVIQALLAAGVPADHQAVQLALRWLLDVRSGDGGWGESCASDEAGRHVALRASTPTQTAWALEALIEAYDRPIPEIDAGIECLIRLLHENDWRASYPTGGGLPGSLYLRYHSDRYSWPLLALAKYRNKYGDV